MVIPTQRLDTPFTPERDLEEATLAAKEARWWYLEPGEEGWDQPLHTYLGFTEDQWREYAISSERRGGR